MQHLYLCLKGTDSKLLLLEISICRYCLSGACLKIMCTISQLVSALLNPITIVEPFMRS